MKSPLRILITLSIVEKYEEVMKKMQKNYEGIKCLTNFKKCEYLSPVDAPRCVVYFHILVTSTEGCQPFVSQKTARCSF